MASILILDTQQDRRENLARYLKDSGYDISGISDPEKLDIQALSNFDMVVLNLHPDADRTWEMHSWFRENHPDLPVVVYSTKTFQAFRSLKQAIASILNNGFEDACTGGCGCSCR